jgi:hypothetical protein
MSWSRKFDEPIPLPRGRALVTRRDTGSYITKLPKAEHEAPEWQAAMQALILVATADACITAYVKATAEAQKATKVAIRDWQQNLDKKASAEFSSRGTTALQTVMLSQVRSELDRLKEVLG